ncbi:flavodoxin domain-containing protein [Chitinophaga sp. MM2321]|uniref:flavodoxin domain-containing protein n=1 Tax=Chitinophaga sp. MM2321 TaxID=3137178 RepID=UPI0032D592A3
MKGIIIYKGKYGATRQYALWLGTILNIPAVIAGSETADQLNQYDYIILGSSIYIGKLQLRKWIRRHQDLLIKKQLFLYLVAGTPASEKEKLQEYITTNISAEIRTRCNLFFLPGKLEFKKLSLPDKILLSIGSRLAKGGDESIVTKDYNDVKKEHLSEIINMVTKLSRVPVT